MSNWAYGKVFFYQYFMGQEKNSNSTLFLMKRSLIFINEGLVIFLDY